MWLDDEANNQIRTAIPFFLLGITLGFALPINVGWRRVTYYWIFMILLAAAAELGQLKLPERQPDIMDFVWGGVGAALGLFPVVAIRMWWQQRSALKRTV
jgi:VanZ family protein